MPTYNFHGHEHTIPDYLADFQQVSLANGYLHFGHPEDPTETQEYRDWFSDKRYDLEEFARLRSSEYETEHFKEEMATPVDIYEPKLGVLYRTRTLNRESGGLPLVAYLGLSTTGAGPAGRADLNTLTQFSGRKIVTIDPIGIGESSKAEVKPDWTLEEMAASNLSVLHRLGVTDMNLMGYSWGGMAAANVAKLAGEDVHNLITVSAPGFKRSLGGFVLSVPKDIIIDKRLYKLSSWNAMNRENMSAIEAIGDASADKPGQGRAYVKLARQVIAPSLANLAIELDPETNWVDIVGSNDGLTHYRDHLAARRARAEQDVPGKSEVYVIGSEKHAWATNTPAWMQVVATTLTRLEEAGHSKRIASAK